MKHRDMSIEYRGEHLKVRVEWWTEIFGDYYQRISREMVVIGRVWDRGTGELLEISDEEASEIEASLSEAVSKELPQTKEDTYYDERL